MRSGSTGSPGEIVDTNVFIYAADPAAGEKRTRSLALVRDLKNRGALVVTSQVLNEIYSVATRPHKPPALSHDEAGDLIRDLAGTSVVLPLTASETLLALDAVGRHGMSFWDALIWATAKARGISTIHTEDVPGAPEIDGVRYHNPFSAAP
jgi:predicted nucleic acid-binding protein